MDKKISKIVVVALATAAISPIYAAAAPDDYNSCAIEVAVASPAANQRVVFNITSPLGINRALTLKLGNERYNITNLVCSIKPYTVTATSYTTSSFKVGQSIGQCWLKAGGLVMIQPGNTASVVFPNDFVCG